LRITAVAYAGLKAGNHCTRPDVPPHSVAQVRKPIMDNPSTQSGKARRRINCDADSWVKDAPILFIPGFDAVNFNIAQFAAL
jgi:hypothetical protein